MLPKGLIGPSSVVSVQIEGIYAKALLDSGSQVTLLYRSFYDKYLKHVPLTPVEHLEIWGLSAAQYPYDGYVCLKLEFTGDVVGVTEAVETLVLVCPDPAVKSDVSILVGTNTSVVRRLFERCKSEGGESFLTSLVIHPIIKETYQKLLEADEQTDDLKGGTVRFSNVRPLTLYPGQTCTVNGISKFSGHPLSKALLIDGIEEGPLVERLLVIPEVTKDKMVLCQRIKVTIRNVSTRQVKLKRGMAIAHVFPVEVVSAAHMVKSCTGSCKLAPSLFNFGESPVSPEWKERLCQKMMERKEVFSCGELDVGCAKSTEHSIRVTNDQPFRERSRRIAAGDVEDVRRHLKDLLEAGIISESRSPYASPIVVVRKKNGNIRMCVDYRTLNRRTIPDQYTVPRIEDALACLTGSQWFSVLDLRSGYYQIPMNKADKEKTAFISPVGFYQFERMPQGIMGAPATFQRIMEKTLGDMNLLEVLVYLDDLIVFGRTLEEHEERLLKVLDRLKDEGLKLSVDKCQFCCTSVNYVGHIVSKDGVATDPAKVDAVRSWPRPESITALRSFLGFCGYYRRFVKDYSCICYPLNQLLHGCTNGVSPKRWCPPRSSCNSSKRLEKGDLPKKAFYPTEPFGSRWDDKCEAAFEMLRKSLTEAPVLAFADPHLPYVLHVDACREGLGGVLYQDQGTGLRPVAFVSRSLTPSEKNYPTHKLEFLALKWAVVDKLHDYLYGAKFEVHTDNNPLTYVLTSAKLDAAGHRWLAALSIYEFTLKYRPGKQNIDADALSRRSHPSSTTAEEDWREVPSSSIRAICQSTHVTCPAFPHSNRLIDFYGACSKAVPQAYCRVLKVNTQQLPALSQREISQSQQDDPCIGEVWKAVRENNITQADRHRHKDVPLLLKEWERFKISGDVLYRVSKLPNKPRSQQMVLPQEFRGLVLRSMHDLSGHLGFDKTYGLVRARFYWPRMKVEVEKYCRTCSRCIQRKTLPQRSAELSHLTSDGPMDLICMDFLSVEPDSKNVSNILVITDHYTRYAQAFPTKDQTATTVAKVFWEKYCIHYGLPKRVHSDQGRDFESRLIHELLGMLGVRKSRTTPYHPQGDPQPERFNRTLLNMLGTLDPKEKSRWSQHISHLVHAYNCTRNEATGYSPYYLMFGREARMPIDLCFGVSSDCSSHKSYLRYVRNMKHDLQAAYQLAESKAGRKNEDNRRRYNQRVRYFSLDAGDRVLIRNLGLQGKHKLADRWAPTPYIVESQLPGLPVFRLRPESGEGPMKTMHRNNLLPLGEDVRLQPERIPELSQPRGGRTLRSRGNRQGPPVPRKAHALDEKGEEAGSDSDAEQDVGYDYYPPLEPLSAGMDTAGEREQFELDLDDVGSLIEHSPDEMLVGDIPNQNNPDDQLVTEEMTAEVDHQRGEQDLSVAVVREGNQRAQEGDASRPQRERRAPTRLTYDKPGTPSFTAVSIPVVVTEEKHKDQAAEGNETLMCIPAITPPIRYISTLYAWVT
uniref:Gypsy retrotransposon integrase-like protein 1 n=1 Tax=Paramormyrops kingsleyae TaxID=1676925 RepID=A0A3B3QDK9_9TELE